MLRPVLLLGAHSKVKAISGPPPPAFHALQALWALVLVVPLVTAPREPQGAEELPASRVVS